MNHKLNLLVHVFFIAVLMGGKKGDEKSRGKRDDVIVHEGPDIYLCIFFISAFVEIEIKQRLKQQKIKMYSADNRNAYCFCVSFYFIVHSGNHVKF